MNSNRVYLLLLLSIMAAFVPALMFRDFSVDLELPFISLALDTLEKGSIYAFDAPGLTYAQTSPIYLWAAMLALSISTKFALPILLCISLLTYLIVLSALDRLLASDFRHQERLLIIVGMSSMLLLDAGVLTARVDMLFTAVQLLAYAKIVKRYKLIHDTAPGELRPKFGNLSIPLLLFTGVFITGFDALVVIVLSLIVLMAMNKELKRFFEVFRPHYFVIMLLCAGLVTLSVAMDGGSEATALFFDKFLSNHSLVNAFREAPEFWQEQAVQADSVLESASLAASGGTGILAAWFTGNDLFSIGLKMFVLFNLPVGLCAVYFLVRQLVVRDSANLKSRACIIFVLVSSLTVFLPDAEHDLYLLPAAPLLYYYVILSYRSMQERAMLRRISQNVFSELSGSNKPEEEDKSKSNTPLIGYEVKSGTAFLASEADLRSDAVQTTKPYVAGSDQVLNPTDAAATSSDSATASATAAVDTATAQSDASSSRTTANASVSNSDHGVEVSAIDSNGSKQAPDSKSEASNTNSDSSADKTTSTAAEAAASKQDGVSSSVAIASSSVATASSAEASSDARTEASAKTANKNASLVLLDASGKPDTSVMTEEQLAAARREEKETKARLKQERLAREQELQNREKAISEVGSAVKRVGELGVEMVNAAPEGSQAMLHALAAMQGGKRIGIEITGKGYLLSALSSRTDRNRLPVLLSAALILPLFAYVSLFIMYITEYGNYPIANHPMIGIGLGFLVFMCLPAAMFVANRLMIFALAILGLGTLGCVFLMSFSLPYVNSFIGIGTQAAAVSARIDKGASNVLCYFGHNGEETPFYMYDTRIITRADDSNLQMCIENKFNVLVTSERIKRQPGWRAILSQSHAKKIGNTYFVPARMKHNKNVPLNTNLNKGTLPLKSATEGAAITDEVAGKARLQLPLHQEPSTEPTQQ